MAPEVTRVRSALTARGLGIRYPVVVRMRTVRAMRDMDILVSPHQVGVTEMRHEADGPRAVITMMAGLPASHFRAVFAHEYSHAFVFGRLGSTLPLRVEEGLAQYVSYTFLKRDEGTPEGRRMADSMLADPDPVYGDGLRMVRHCVHRYGFQQMWQAMRAGQLTKVGLS